MIWGMAATESCAPEITWPVPPGQGWFADDLDHIPDLPPHTELLYGTLVFRSPQTAFHADAMFLLQCSLRRTVPEHLDVQREMTITLGPRDRPEPDVLVIKADAQTGPDHVFELERATRSYVAKGIFRKELKLAVPFEITIDLTAINRRP